MALSKYVLLSGLTLTTAVFAAKMDKKDTINGVTVESGKHNSTRLYKGAVAKNFPYNIAAVKNSIVNFQEKCNNSFKDQRKFTDKKANCKYHNENLIETIVVKNIKTTGWTKEANETERYVLGRRIYNRGNFGHYEMVKIFETKNEKNQKVVTIVQKMMSDKEARVYTKPAFERDSAFEKTNATFVLTEVSPTETALTYEYNAETEHWILNKEVSVPQVFASISKSINDLVKTVSAESPLQTRDLASF